MGAATAATTPTMLKQVCQTRVAALEDAMSLVSRFQVVLVAQASF